MLEQADNITPNKMVVMSAPEKQVSFLGNKGKH